MEARLVKRFVFYGLLGYILEILWTGTESLIMYSDLSMKGTSYVWMFFVYGLAVFLEPIQDKLKNYNMGLRGLCYMVLIFIAEFISGLAFLKLIGKCPWNYTDSMSIGGIITLSFAPVWFSLGLIFERIRKVLDRLKLTVVRSNKKGLYYPHK